MRLDWSFHLFQQRIPSALNEFTYQQYRVTFRRMLNDLTPEILDKITTQVEDELMTVSRNPEIAQASLFLGKESFKPDAGKESIRVALDFLKGRRNALLKQME